MTRLSYSPAAMLTVRRAAEAWAPTTDELALHAVADEGAYVRAVCGTPWSETTLDDALRVKRAQVGRALRAFERAQLAAARATLKDKRGS